MGSKSLFKWTKQITASQVEQLIRAERDVQKALMIFDSATAEYANGFKHELNTFSLMISKLVSANQFRSAEALLDRMKEEKCDVKEDVFLTVCRAYGRVHKALDTIRVFHKMEEFQCRPTEKSYITVFSILVDENELKIALRFYKYMRKAGFPPSVPSLNVLIKALCKNSGTIDAAVRIFHEMPNRGCTPDAYTYGTLINGFCRMGKIDEAKKLFIEMETKSVSPSVITYTSLIHGLCQSNHVDEAVELFDEMTRKNVEPNVFTYSSLMDGYCKSGQSMRAKELLELMVSKRQTPNMISYSSLIYGFCQEGKLKEALELLDRMKLQGLKPDAGLYGKVINGFCDDGKFQEAANLLEEMVLARILPNQITWSLHVKIHNKVVCGLCDIGEANRAFHVYLSMRTRGISINAETFGSLVRVYCKKGELEKVGRVVNEMVVDECVPEEETWRRLVNRFWDERKVCKDNEVLLFELMNQCVEHEI